MRCELHLTNWKIFMHQVDSLTHNNVYFLIVVNTKDERRICHLIKTEDFDLPIYIDTNNYLNKINNFPSNSKFNTFLLNNNNQVVLIGSPIENYEMKNLYFNTLLNKEFTGEFLKTYININQSTIKLGEIEEGIHECKFNVENRGPNPLIIADILSSCGCMNLKYSKRPVDINKKLELKVNIRLTSKGYLRKSLTIFCNTNETPIVFFIEGSVI